MKLLLLFPLFLLGASAGAYRLGTTPGSEQAPRASAECSPLDCPLTECPRSDCRVSVECTPRGTCLVTCLGANDEVLCQEEVTCDEPCEEPCPKPCEGASTARSCSRQ